MDSVDSSLLELSGQLPQEILDSAFHSFAQAVTPHVMLDWSGAESPLGPEPSLFFAIDSLLKI